MLVSTADNSKSKMNLRAQVSEIIGRTERPDVLDTIKDLLSGTPEMTRILETSGDYIGPKEGRPEDEVLNGAHVLRAATFLATRSYEGKPITTGLAVLKDKIPAGPDVEATAINVLRNHTSWKWIASWPSHLQPSIRDHKLLYAISSLADGKNSFFVADLAGRLIGVIDTQKDSFETLVINYGEFAVMTDHHRQVHFMNSGGDVRCYHDGFQWVYGANVDPGIMAAIDIWAHRKEDQPYLDRITEQGHGEFPKHEDADRWWHFQKLLSEMSMRRYSGLFAICEAAALDVTEATNALTPLRPEFEGFRWGDISSNISSWANIFKMDGAHTFSTDMKLLRVCQRVSVPSAAETAGGTGRVAAMYLSTVLGRRGVVFKVSADGPATTYFDGKKASESDFW